MSMALPAMSLAQLFLSSCSDTPTNDDVKNPVKRIGIIGAGVAGLNSAFLLNQDSNLQIQVLEASDSTGGRILSNNTIESGHNIEFGANQIFGNNNSFFNMVAMYESPKPINTNTNPYFYIDSEAQDMDTVQNNPDFISAMNCFDKSMNFAMPNDLTYKQLMLSEGVPESVRFIYTSKMEQFIGSSIDKVNAKPSVTETNFKNNSTPYTVNKSFNSILKSYYQSVLTKVETSKQVKEIDYSQSEIVVKTADGDIRKYDRLIITVPISVLKDNDIQFTPELPDNKTNALSKLGMDGGIKVVVKLTKNIWPADATHLYLNGNFNEIEVTKVNSNFILTALVKGSVAETLSQKNDNEIINDLKKEFEYIYGTNTFMPIASKVISWNKMPFIKGVYSYHKLGGTINDRVELAKSIDNKLFFAGEATNSDGLSGTIQGAIESSIRAVNELKTSLK